MAILTELNDPRVQDVTVTYVEVSSDLRRAKVHVSVMGDETKQQLSLRGLKSAAGFLQSRCADRIDTRYTPRIQFLLDQGVKKSIEVSRILDRVLPREAEGDGSDEEPEAGVANQTEPEAAETAPLESIHPPPDGVDSTPENPGRAS
jgi:ribosome-binding factor A